MGQFNELLESISSIEEIAAMAEGNEDILAEMLEGISPRNKNTKLRNKCHNALILLSENRPEILYKKWDYFVELIKSGDSFPKTNGFYVIANIVKVDREDKFKKIFDLYFNLINDITLPVAAHAARLSGKIAVAKPEMQPEITERLLNIDSTCLNIEHLDIIKGYIVEAFDFYFEDIKEKTKITGFIRAQLKSTSPRTKKVAKDFLKKHNL